MKKTSVDDVDVEVGSDNIFADLGVSNPEEHLVKAQLMRAINGEIRRRSLTQEQAAELVGLKQPELSRISRGRSSGFSADRLIGILNSLGLDVEIRLLKGAGVTGQVRVLEDDGRSQVRA